MSDEKYKQFRNYMTSELGITRQDIEAWTKQSVATEVNKALGMINLEGHVQRAVRESISNINYASNKEIRELVAKNIAASLDVVVSLRAAT